MEKVESKMEEKAAKTVKVYELLRLEGEICGLSRNYPAEMKLPPEEMLKGMLSQPISGASKYHLNKLLAQIKEERELVDTLQKEILAAHEVEFDEAGIPKFKDEESEKAANEQLKAVLEQDVVIKADLAKLGALLLRDLEELKTGYNYPLLYELI